MSNDAELSKALSHALRHEPWLYELELDDEGWASLDAVLEALKSQRDEWQDLLLLDLMRVVESSSKRRHEIIEGRIRALYGHSVPGKLRHELASPPSILLHGTSPEAATVIVRKGLLPLKRQYVHLSIDVATAMEVARRKSKTPMLFEVEAQAAHKAGILFYVGNERVWLADSVPARFLRIATEARCQYGAIK